MAKAKAPRWLTQAFQQGVDAFAAEETPIGRVVGNYEGTNRFCWLAAHDPAKRPCTPGRLERFHFIRRQDVEGAMWAQLREARIWRCQPGVLDPCLMFPWERDELILIVAWDPRNGGLACEQHHRRYDQHQVSLPSERLIVPRSALPSRVVEFAGDYSDFRLLERFVPE